MKITKVESIAIQAPPADSRAYWGSRAWGGAEQSARHDISMEYPVQARRRYIYSKTIDTVIVAITTDDGLVGYGEAKAPVAPQVTKEIVDRLLAGIVLGADPRDVTVLWERMYAGMRVRGHKAGFYLEAMSGVDIALWDLAGKAAGVPIARLLGGSFRESVRVYASGLPTLDFNAPDEHYRQMSDEGKELQKAGYTGVKMALGRGIKGDLKSIRALRDAMGDDFIIYADAAGCYDTAQAMYLGKALEELGVAWFEMPIFPEDVDGYAELARQLTIPIALDSLTTRYETAEFIRKRALDVVQPDVCRAGGITECRRIAELADAFGVAFAPHISIGSAIHFVASAHLASAMPNTITSEYWIGKNPIGDNILEEPFALENGYMRTPTGAGLGVKINEKAMALQS